MTNWFLIFKLVSNKINWLLIKWFIPLSVQVMPSHSTPESIDPSYKSHNASDKYPTMYHFVTEMCTCLLQNGALWDMGLVHCGICAASLFLVISNRIHSKNNYTECFRYKSQWVSYKSDSRNRVTNWSSKPHHWKAKALMLPALTRRF